LPALDFRDGIVYVTLPATYYAPKKIGKGKDAVTIEEETTGTMCVTSTRAQFSYDRETLADLGFRWPPTFVQQTDESRWSLTHVGSFLEGAVERPEPAALFRSVKSVYERYVEFADPRVYDLMALFVMATYVFRAFRSMAYIHFNGSRGSGKSRNVKILEALAFNTVYSANSTPASLFRQIAGCPGTICIDEAEHFESEDAKILRAILNAGYTDGANVQRAEATNDNQWVNRQFAAFSPKALASINQLDSVLADRCIVVNMAPALRNVPEFDDKNPAWQGLRDQLYLWTMYWLPQVQAVNDRWQAETRYERAPKLQNRPWQLAQMYLVLADVVGGDDLVEEMLAFFTEYYAEQQAALDATDRLRLVLKVLPGVLKTAEPEDDGFYSLKTIHDAVGEYLDEDQKDPKRFTTRTTGRNLEALGIRVKRTKRNGLQFQVHASHVRNAMAKRRVDPFDEDREWFETPDGVPLWVQEYADEN
jgi:hypothetical protein